MYKTPFYIFDIWHILRLHYFMWPTSTLAYIFTLLQLFAVTCHTTTNVWQRTLPNNFEALKCWRITCTSIEFQVYEGLKCHAPLKDFSTDNKSCHEIVEYIIYGSDCQQQSITLEIYVMTSSVRLTYNSMEAARQALAVDARRDETGP